MSSEKLHISYNFIHKLCQETAVKIREDGKPDVIVAIGGGGFIPARILRSFIKLPGEKNIPIQAIGLSLYEDMGNGEDAIGKEVIRTQWLDFGALSQHFDSLIGKTVLIIDEVDDTRTTLHYAVSELYKDVKEMAEKLGRQDEITKFNIFVLHNKNKPKRAEIDFKMLGGGQYYAARDVPDAWIAYPWEAVDIDEHQKQAERQGFV
ncbi:Xanthine phosphoribosyltransferase 1 [Komagataella kurtzmanii]|nr:Xanthine phosphoribosyltransferase 1 [Komagataella kurtzmanii]